MGKIFDFDFMIEVIPRIMRGIPYTVVIAVFAFAVGLVIGFFGALCKIYKVPVLRQLVGLYVSFIRGTPLVVQIMLTYFGFPIVIRQINAAWGTSFDVSGIPALSFMLFTYSFNAGAYLTESIRAALTSVNKIQLEAAYSLGMSTWQAMRRIIIPQAAKMSLPVFTNFFIGLLKDTSLAFTAAVPEIMGQAKIVAGQASRFFEAYIDAALIYWVICIILERVLAVVEKKQHRTVKE